MVLLILGLHVTFAEAFDLKYIFYKKYYDFVKRDLKDPQSTIFRDCFKSSTDRFCGEFNSKNTYGAYVGFKRFIVYREPIFGNMQMSIEGADVMTSDGVLARSDSEVVIIKEQNRRISNKEKVKKLTTEERELVAISMGFNQEWEQYCKK